MQYLRWAQIKWFDDDPSTACYECEKCNEHIPHAKKRWMVERGEWRETKPVQRQGTLVFIFGRRTATALMLRGQILLKSF